MKIIEMLFGKSWKTSLIGYLGLAAGALATAMSAQTEPGYVLLGIAFAALARAAKDGDKTGV